MGWQSSLLWHHQCSLFWRLCLLWSRTQLCIQSFFHVQRVGISKDDILFDEIISRFCPCHPDPFEIGNYRSDELEVVSGGLQDFSYLFTNTMELTVEVSCNKRPGLRSVTRHWRHNYRSMLSMMAAVDGGVAGAAQLILTELSLLYMQDWCLILMVMLFPKLISWLKVLTRLPKHLIEENTGDF